MNADGIQGFSVSPDGSRLALVAFFRPKDGPEQRVIMTVAASGGLPTEISRPKQMARDVFWSKDGRHLIWATKPQVEGQRNELFSIPAEGGEPQPFGLELNDVKFLDLSSDGAHLVFTDQHPQNSLWVMKIPPQAPSATR